MSVQTYTTSGNTQFVNLPITITQDSKINFISITSSNGSFKYLDMIIYVDGVNPTTKMRISDFRYKIDIVRGSLLEMIFSAGSKIEFIVEQTEGELSTINMTIQLEEGVSNSGGGGSSPTTGNALSYHSGTLNINASSSQDIILNENSSQFNIKSMIIDTINKNVNIDIYYMVNGTYKLVKTDTLMNLSTAYTYSSDIMTTDVKITVTNNDSNNSITIDWEATNIVY